MTRRKILAAAIVVAAIASAIRMTAAGPILVNTTAMTTDGSDGACSLIEAIGAANSDVASGPAAGECAAGGTGLDVIHVPAGTYTITAAASGSGSNANGLPPIDRPIEIAGDGAANTIIERSLAAGTPDFRLFYVRYTGFAQYELTGSLVLRNVTVRNGRAEYGGGIYIQSTNQLSNALIDSVLAGHSADVAGAVYATATYTVRGSRVENNFARYGPGAMLITNHLAVEHSVFDGNRTDGIAGATSLGFGGTMDVSDSVFVRNSAGSSAGAISAGGATVNITRSWLHANRAEASGGAIGAERMVMSYTTVTDNTAVTGAGGGVTVNGWGDVRHSTFSGNSAGSAGGGISGANLTMANSTASGNRATHEGGGIHAAGSNAYFVGNNLTVTNNHVTSPQSIGGGLSFGSVSPAKISNSVIAGNYAGQAGKSPDCVTYLPPPGITSSGHNLIGNACGCIIVPAEGDLFGTYDAPIDPLLGPLQAHGGLTQTHGPRTASLVIDAASPRVPGSDPAACEAVDQRDVLRPIDGDGDAVARGDRGAVEWGGDPFPARPAFSAASYSVDEPGGVVTIRVDRADPAGELAVTFSAATGSADGGADFVATAGTLTFLDGEATRTFDVAILDDAVLESTESIHVSLRNPADPPDALPLSSAIVFVKDDDSVPLTRPFNATSAEGHTGTRDLHVTVGITQAYVFNVHVAYQTVDGEAVAGVDYEAASGVVGIGGGTSSGTLTLKIMGDTIDEIDETFRLRLTTTIGCVSEIRYATITIVDDDVPNRGPVITDPGDQSDLEGELVSLAIDASDPDGTALTFSATALPPGLSIDASTGVIGGTVSAGTAGTYATGVSVSDGELTAGVVFDWTIVAPNRAPTLIASVNQANVEGDLASLVLSASDPDVDTLIYSVTGLPPGLAIDRSTGVISGSLAPGSHGSYTVAVSVSDGQTSATGSFVWVVTAPPAAANRAPVCDAAQPALPEIWPPNHKKKYAIGIRGVVDPDGDPVRIRITRILQDEPTNTNGDGDTWVDGGGIGTATAWVRAERQGGGDGRVYEIAFTATDAKGASCTGKVSVAVPHDQGPGGAVDSGCRWDSTVAKGPVLMCRPGANPPPGGHQHGDRCDHERGRGGHHDNDDCDHERDRDGRNRGSHGHRDGDRCDHDRKRNGHRDGDRCEHDRGRR